MSRIHLQVNKIFESTDKLIFEVTSIDFASEFTHTEIGILTAYLDENWLEFTSTNIWSGKKLIPLYVFSLCDIDMKRLLRTVYKHYSHRSYMSMLYSMGMKKINDWKLKR